MTGTVKEELMSIECEMRKVGQEINEISDKIDKEGPTSKRFMLINELNEKRLKWIELDEKHEELYNNMRQRGNDNEEGISV